MWLESELLKTRLLRFMEQVKTVEILINGNLEWTFGPTLDRGPILTIN